MASGPAVQCGWNLKEGQGRRQDWQKVKEERLVGSPSEEFIRPCVTRLLYCNPGVYGSLKMVVGSRTFRERDGGMGKRRPEKEETFIYILQGVL